jgi:hypothetical protein
VQEKPELHAQEAKQIHQKFPVVQTFKKILSHIVVEIIYNHGQHPNTTARGVHNRPAHSIPSCTLVSIIFIGQKNTCK